jgi:hypothetical protein
MCTNIPYYPKNFPDKYTFFGFYQIPISPVQRHPVDFGFVKDPFWLYK